MRVSIIRAAGIMLLLAPLQGCGHKGSLYLPSAAIAPQQSDQSK